MMPVEGSSSDYVEIIKPLPWRLRLAYGIGHILNDVCASMWFTYLLVYFHLVLKFSSSLSGRILLVGQVADALATPFVGLQSDRTDDFWLCSYGRRKTWHLIGTVCVLGSFPFIFSTCIHCEDSHQWAQMFYYSAFVIIFQFGWASVQISHLSLIPDLTPCEHERTSLTAVRYSFTVISNIFVYVITWGVLHMADDCTAQIGPKDAGKFQKIVFICIGVGAVASMIFHICVRECTVNNGLTISSQNRKSSIGRYLKSTHFYQVAVVYMATRLFVNLTQVYIPLYLHESLNKGAESLAIVPLVMFLASFCASLVVKILNKKFGRKMAYLQGAALGLAACLWIYFGPKDYLFKTYYIYVVAIMLGAAGSLILVTSLGITADFIGPNTERGAFVYGAMSFCDKLSNGVAVTIIQDMKCLTNCSWYYGDILAYVCGGSLAVGLVFVLTIRPFHNNMKGEGMPYAQLDTESENDIDGTSQVPELQS